MKRVVLPFVLLLSACDARVTPSAPSVVAVETTVVPPPSGTAVVVPPTVAPPSSATPPVVTRPFLRTDCDYSNLGSIRCYNPSNEVLVLSAASIGAGATGCNAQWAGVHENVRIAPGANGYFTVPGPACGQVYQLDMFKGSSVGNCVTPDFSAERTYPLSGVPEPCSTPPQSPPPSPCVKPGRVHTNPSTTPPVVCQ